MSGSTVLWIAGVGWDQVTGTDKRIVLELSRIRPVVWIDPPVPLRRPGPIGASAPECVAPGVSRVRVTVLPGVTRWGLRTLTARIVESVTEVQSTLHEMLSAIPVLDANIVHSDAQHARIVKAILAGRSSRARQVMEEHCDDTAALLRGLLG